MCAAQVLAQAPASFAEEWEFSALGLWESRYVSEGREDLEDGGLFSSELVAAYDGFEFSAWAGLADSEHYQELQLTAAYVFDYRGFEFAAGYTHLEFEPGSDDDDEVFAEISTELFEMFVIGLSCVYYFEAKGSFYELVLGYPLTFLDEKLLVEPYALAGFDFDYRTEDYDGHNHLQFGIDCEYVLTDRLSLVGYVAHSFAGPDIDREGLGDVSWFGLGVVASF
ncbi:MAG: hypothetical protein ACPGES_11310 [Coraliomargarita sp.]